MYALTSLAEISALVSDICYLTKCNLSSSQKNVIVFNLVLIFIILVKRLYLFLSTSSLNSEHNNSNCSIYFKGLLFLMITLVTYITQILFYNKLDNNECSVNINTYDRLVIQLMIGIVVCIYELDYCYKCIRSVRRDINSRISIQSVIPIQNQVIIISGRDNNQDEKEINNDKTILINKINSIESNSKSSDDDSSTDNKVCSICLTESDTIILPNCKHSYHKECIINWIKQSMSSSTKCPVCRTEI